MDRATLLCVLLSTICLAAGDDCSPPDDISNGKYEDYTYTGWPSRIRHIVYSCNEGYKLKGNKNLYCYDGEWTAFAPTCEAQFKSCKEIKASQTEASNGIYTIFSECGEAYSTYCEMETSDGGWTLVASIHENDMDGKCTEGDKWSSEDGVVERHGNTFWDNDEIYGSAEAATSDDYKNQGYFEIDAEQLMIIQVPNDEPTDKYVSSASFQYTTVAFLQEYGGNLQGLFKAYPIIDDRTMDAEKDDGPAVEINFVKGSAREAFKQYGYDMQDEMVSGYMQFRAINKEHGATAFCPYGKMKGGWASSSSTEHGCFAATVADVSACGDFSAFDGIFNDVGLLNNWATDREMRKSAFLILYR
jgi:intelectin